MTCSFFHLFTDIGAQMLDGAGNTGTQLHLGSDPRFDGAKCRDDGRKGLPDGADRSVVSIIFFDSIRISPQLFKSNE